MNTDLNNLTRRKQKLFDSRTALILCVIIIGFAVTVFLVLNQRSSQNVTSGNPYWTSEKQFKYANTLFSKGLKNQALVEYEKYFEMRDASSADRANVAYQTLSGSEPKSCLRTLADGTGDCDDQSILLISLCRASDIPSWLAFGILYDQVNAQWGPHAWAEVYLNMFGWVRIDLSGAFCI